MKNNSMINYLNNSHKYNKAANVKLLPKTKSLNNFNKNTFKILRQSNKLDNSSSEPIKIKANQEKTYLNQNFINKSKTPNRDVILNNMIQEYDYLNYMNENLKNNNLSMQKNRYKLKINRPSTAPQKNNNKKVGINKLNKSLNNSNYNNSANNENKPLYNYYSNNSVKLKNHIIKRTKNNFANPNMYNKIFRFPRYRPPSPMIEPGIRLVN